MPSKINQISLANTLLVLLFFFFHNLQGQNHLSGQQNVSLTMNQVNTTTAGEVDSFFTFATKLDRHQLMVSSNVQPNQPIFSGTATTLNPPQTIPFLSGNHQTGNLGQVLDDRVKVRLVDQYENPISDSTIQFLNLGGTAVSDNLIKNSTAATIRGGAQNFPTKYRFTETGLLQSGRIHTVDERFGGAIATTAQQIPAVKTQSNDEIADLKRATVTYEGGLSPTSVTTGDTVKSLISLQVSNSGPTDIVLDASQTILSFGIDTLNLASGQIIPSGGLITTIYFETGIIQSAVHPSGYPVILNLSGLESTIPFSQVLPADNIRVYARPTDVVVQNFDIDSTSASSVEGGISLRFDVFNPSNSSTIQIKDSSDLSLFGQGNILIESVVSPAHFPVNIAPGNIQSFELRIGFPKTNQADLKTFWAGVDYIDINSNSIYHLNPSTVNGQIQILRPSDLEVLGITFSADTVSQGQMNVGIEMSVRNNSQVAAQLLSANLIFFNPHQITPLTTPLPTIQPGEAVTISYSVNILPNASLGIDSVSASLIYRNIRNNKISEVIIDNISAIFIQQANTDLVNIQSVEIQSFMVNQGQINIPAKVNVRNGGQSAIEISALKLFFVPAGLTQSLLTTIPDTLAGQSNGIYDFLISIPPETNPGLYRVDAQMAFKDIYLNEPNNKIGAIIPDSILVNTPAKLILSPILVDGNPSYLVSTGKQDISLEFSLINSGQSTVRIDSIVRQNIPAHILTTRLLPQALPTISGEDSSYFVYDVDVGDNTGNFTLNFKAYGNDLIEDKIIESEVSVSPANILIREAGVISIDSVVVAADTVFRGQDSIKTTVYLKNSGAMPVQVKNIFLNFEESGFTAKLLDTLGYNLEGQATSSNNLIIAVLNSAPFGKIGVGAGVTAIELSLQQELETVSSKNDSFLVMYRALIRVDTTHITNLPNYPKANQSQEISIRTTINNLSGFALEDVQLSLLQNDTLIATQAGLSILPGNILETFFITPAPVRLDTSIYKVRIDSAFSTTGREPAKIEQPKDNSELIFVEKAALLKLVLQPSSRSFLPGNNYTFNSEASNLGTATATGGKVEMILPDNFSFSAGENPIQDIDGVGVASWKIEADDILYSEWDDLIARFYEVPVDLNTGTAAALFTSSDTSQIKIGTSSVILSTTDISDPPGAVDGIVSTNQLFTIYQEVEFLAGFEEGARISQLFLPEGYSLVGFSQIEWMQENTHEWKIKAPAQASTNDVIKILTMGVESEGAIIDSIENFIPVQVENAALLGIQMKLVGLPDTLSGHQLSFNQEFKIRAKVFNSGDADISGIGKLKLMLTPQDSLVIVEGDVNEIFTDNDSLTVDWLLKAPNRAISSNIRVGFFEIPNDTNSSMPAQIDPQNGIASLSISTTIRTIKTRKIAEIQPSSSLRQGTTNVPLLGLEFFNEQVSQSIKTVSIDSIFLEFKGLGERTLDLAIDKIRIEEYNDLLPKLNHASRVVAEYNVKSGSSHLIQIKFTDALKIEPAEKRNLKISVDLKNDSHNMIFSMLIQDIIGYELETENRVGLVDSNGRPFEQRKIYESLPVTIISSDESEIFGNYPNPFPQGIQDEFTRFVFLAKGSGNAEVFIYTLLGGLVWSEKIDYTGTGDHLIDGNVTWDGVNNTGNQVLNGIYIAIIHINDNGGSRTFKTKVAYIK